MGKSYNQRNAKVDANQPEIVKALRQAGAIVRSVHTIKKFFDILVAFRGQLYIMEIKNVTVQKYEKETPEEKRERLESMLKDGEKECMEQFQSVGVPYHIVATAEEALDIIFDRSSNKHLSVPGYLHLG